MGLCTRTRRLDVFVSLLLREKGITVDRRRIDLEGGIKSLGDHQVRIELHPEVVAEITVTVEPEE